MAKMTPAEIGQVTRQAFVNLTQDDNDVQTAVAIALAESGGDPAAVNDNTNGSRDYGLFQINSVHYKDKPDFDKEKGTVTLNGRKINLFDPADNAQQAAWLFARRGNKFTDWSAYKNGRYRQFLDAAKGQTAMGIGETLTENTIGNDASLTSGITEPITAGFNTLSEQISKVASSAGTWVIAVLFFVVGIVLVSGGVATKIAKRTPVGKVAKAVVG